MDPTCDELSDCIEMPELLKNTLDCLGLLWSVLLTCMVSFFLFILVYLILLLMSPKTSGVASAVESSNTKK